MTTMGSQITSLMVVYSIIYSDAVQGKHQSSASLAFEWGIHWDRWIPRTKGQLRGKCFHLMTSSCNWLSLQCLVPWINHLPLHVGPVSEIKFHLVCKFNIMNNIFFHCVNSLNMYSISTKIIYVMYVVFTLMIIGPECEAQNTKLCKMCTVELYYFLLVFAYVRLLIFCALYGCTFISQSYH